MIHLGAVSCGICGRLRVRPLFFIQENGDSWPVCHTHIDQIIGKEGAAATLGPWEAQLSGNTWVVKVRR